jgi:Uma2 family endonuclease
MSTPSPVHYRITESPCSGKLWSRASDYFWNNRSTVATESKPFLTPEQYLEQERRAEFRSEYLAGEVFAMSGGTRYHGRIVTNALTALNTSLRSRPCNVYATDLRVHIPATGLYTYPDIVVTCGKEEFLDDQFDTLLNPLLIIEVLSPSTADYDRGGKFFHYRSIPFVAEYLTIAQDRVLVEHWIRQSDHSWLFADHARPDETILLKTLNVELNISALYEKVEFRGAEPPINVGSA